MKTRHPCSLQALVARNGGHVHMLGMCGIGMAGVAFLLKQRGFYVSGCDRAQNRQGTWLDKYRISLSVPHDPEHIDDSVDWIIRSPAVPADHPELKRAAEKGIPVFRRGEVLPAMLAESHGIAVAGTHGKTTTATLITQLLRGAGRDPSWCIGGESSSLGGVAGEGGDATIVVEADESDGTLALYHPDIAVITNIEFDHMEHFESESQFEACFRAFITQTGRRVIYCADDPRAARLCADVKGALGYGFGDRADLQCHVLQDEPDGQDGSPPATRVLLTLGNKQLGELIIPLPGCHNILNMLAATAVCLEEDVAFADIASAVANVALPKRRFEVVLQANDITVISDYAHHPSEIAALVQMARAQHSGRLIAVFQPHRYTRTLALGDNFPAAFEGVDKLILTPVYAASEDPIAGGRICDLYARFRDDSSICPQLARSLEQAWGYLRRELQPGDMLLVIGAGDVENIGAWAASEGFSGGRGIIASADDMPELSAKSSLKLNEPLGKKTTYGVGGTADYWVEVGSVEDLAAVLKRSHSSGLPFRVLGAGSNVLVSDLGVRGVVVRLTGDIFRGISLEDGVVRAGGALPISRLLDWLADQSLTGLEFLEGIPGSVGGIVRMNGGAYGSEIREKVVWIRGLNRDGSECTLRADALKWGYRGCQSLEGVVVVEVGLALNEGDSESIRCERGAIAGRRSWQRGLRCSGSVFRNPPDESAGRIVEALGLKSSRIGGAFVSDRHGNFVVADKDATASDVFALIEYLQFAVKDKRGIELVREVVYLE